MRLRTKSVSWWLFFRLNLRSRTLDDAQSSCLRNALKTNAMRKQLLSGMMILGSMLAGSSASAQEIPHNFCGSDQRLKELFAQDPQLEEDYRQFLIKELFEPR